MKVILKWARKIHRRFKNITELYDNYKQIPTCRRGKKERRRRKTKDLYYKKKRQRGGFLPLLGAAVAAPLVGSLIDRIF